ncbi:hypothetical protein BO99DRAFT_406005 [Aspergillus violaceofuscus CBS 115571]|uniref:Uncharacterized protein n=1 Tax=Aspergillus violaceofuscus (strain CBS 115571) TaxID=1450538 RepID=A0A2V5GVB0_ASPV1|nr:hypothetical protein BO99DRAFT_406005 [Aspergillus violaceofuscus CBS 115571]
MTKVRFLQVQAGSRGRGPHRYREKKNHDDDDDDDDDDEYDRPSLFPCQYVRN